MVVYYMKYSKYIVSVGVRYWEGHTMKYSKYIVSAGNCQQARLSMIKFPCSFRAKHKH